MAQRVYFFRKTSPALDVEIKTDVYGDDIINFTVTNAINLTDEAIKEGLDIRIKDYTEQDFIDLATTYNFTLVRFDGVDEDELVAEV